MKKSYIALFLLFLAAFAPPSNGACQNVPATGNCAGGCWNQHDLVFNNGYRYCVPVEPGYYSPAHSNERIACPYGHYSEEPEADHCDICQPGEWAHPHNSFCIPCPTGSYQDLPGQEYCLSCDITLYDGTASTNITDDGFCVKDSPAPSMVPSVAPSTEPTTQPSSIPSQPPSSAPSLRPSVSPSNVPSEEPTSGPSQIPSEEPSVFPSEEPTLVVTTPLDIDESVCEADEQALHGLCTACPNLFWTIFSPVFWVCILGGVALLFILFAPQITAILFILVDYMQKLYLIGTIPVKWPAVMKWMFGICGKFAVDLDVIVPLQCIFGLDKQSSKMLTQCMPVIWGLVGAAGISVWCIRQQVPVGPPMKRFVGLTMIVLHLCYQTLVQASLEAIQCSPVYNTFDQEAGMVDMMCWENGTTRDKAIAVLSILFGAIYGIVYPVLSLWLVMKYKEAVHKEKVAEATDETSETDIESQGGQVVALREQATKTEPNPIKDALRPFITVFSEQKWRWPLVLVGMKLLSVLFVVFGGEVVVVSQLLMLVIEVFVAAVTFCESPYDQDYEGDNESQTESQRSFRLRPLQLLDIVLRGIAVCILAFGIVLQFLDTAADSRVLIGILGIAVPSGGVVYVSCMAIKAIRERGDHEVATAGQELKNNSGLTTVVRRKTEEAPPVKTVEEEGEEDDSPIS